MLRLAASLADHAPVSLGEAVTGIDERNVGLLVKAIATPPDDASSPSDVWRLSTALATLSVGVVDLPSGIMRPVFDGSVDLVLDLVPHCASTPRDEWKSQDGLRPLSDLGLRQADILGEVLGPVADAVYSSPSLRCRQSRPPSPGGQAQPEDSQIPAAPDRRMPRRTGLLMAVCRRLLTQRNESVNLLLSEDFRTDDACPG
jgi:hypothetical protein